MGAALSYTATENKVTQIKGQNFKSQTTNDNELKSPKDRGES